MPSTTPAPTCHHIFADRHRCGSPALRGERFCYFAAASTCLPHETTMNSSKPSAKSSPASPPTSLTSTAPACCSTASRWPAGTYDRAHSPAESGNARFYCQALKQAKNKTKLIPNATRNNGHQRSNQCDSCEELIGKSPFPSQNPTRKETHSPFPAFPCKKYRRCSLFFYEVVCSGEVH